MSTAINITVNDGGLPVRNRQQVAANRQAFVQNVATEKSTALGIDQRSQDRIAQGRDPATGALLIPPSSTGALGVSGGGIPRLNQQPAANRILGDSSVWLIDHKSALTQRNNAFGELNFVGQFKNGNTFLPYSLIAVQLNNIEGGSAITSVFAESNPLVGSYISASTTSQYNFISCDLNFCGPAIQGDFNYLPQRPLKPFAGISMDSFFNFDPVNFNDPDATHILFGRCNVVLFSDAVSPSSAVMSLVLDVVRYRPNIFIDQTYDDYIRLQYSRLENGSIVESMDIFIAAGSTGGIVTGPGFITEGNVDIDVTSFLQDTWNKAEVSINRSGLIRIKLNNLGVFTIQAQYPLQSARYYVLARNLAQTVGGFYVNKTSIGKTRVVFT